MSYAISTLFEGNYHYGVAALSNSLYQLNFQGSVYVGYRGKLPDWAAGAKATTLFQWEGSRTLDAAEGLQLHFLPLDTHYHLSNYKPTFMLRLFEGPAKEAEGLLYFDPDIVVKCGWEMFENWLSFGVAVVHDLVANDMPAPHPVRQGWKRLIKESNREITSDLHSYLNGGFCGLNKSHIVFLEVWPEFMELAATKFGYDITTFRTFPNGHVFYSGDQDAFNIAAMCSGCPMSELGPEGMDFLKGGWAMSHATSSPKPWGKNYIKGFFNGKAPGVADHNFWNNASYPLAPFTKTSLMLRVRLLKIASFIGRFYRRY